MKLKNFILIMMIIVTYGCGFTSIYSNNNNYDFSIKSVTFEGDSSLNNYLKSNLIKYQNRENKTQFVIDINTKYEKNVLTKSETGKITNYELYGEVIINIQPGNKKISFKEKKLMESMSDKFQERK